MWSEKVIAFHSYCCFTYYFMANKPWKLDRAIIFPEHTESVRQNTQFEDESKDSPPGFYPKPSLHL